MTTFIITLSNLIPLYLIILIGFLLSKKISCCKQTISSILIYILTPIVVFQGISTLQLNSNDLLLPLGFFSLACLISTIFLFKSPKNQLSPISTFSSGTANVGYFGLPVILSILGNEAFSLAILCILGFVLYENTLGYIIATNNKNPFKKLIRHPFIHAFIAGIIIKLLNIEINQNLNFVLDNFKATYSTLGMLIIGIGINDLSKAKINYKYLKITLLAKFLIWPIISLLFILTDIYITKLLSQQSHIIILIFSFAPIAANTVAYASLLQLETKSVSFAVLISTILSLFLIPSSITIFNYLIQYV